MGIPDHLTCLLRKLYAGQKATFRTGHGTADWFQIGIGKHQGCTSLPCSFKLYAECIMWNAGLNEAQAGIKIAGRNMNNFRYAGDTTLMADSETCWWKWKRRMKKLAENSAFTKWRSWGPVPSLHGTQWKQWKSLFSWAPKSLQLVTAAMMLKDTCSLEKKLWQN